MTTNMRYWYPHFKGIWGSEVDGKGITLTFVYLLKSGPTEEEMLAVSTSLSPQEGRLKNVSIFVQT